MQITLLITVVTNRTEDLTDKISSIRTHFGRELVEVWGNLVIPWCVGGDLNEIRFVRERKGGGSGG